MEYVGFKSDEIWFGSELRGDKNWTVRRDDGGARFERLREYMYTGGELEICITHSQDVSRFFNRGIKYVCYIDGLYYITWRC